MNDVITRSEQPVDGPEVGEYLSVPVRCRRESLHRDVYTHLGWTVDAVVERSADTTTLRLSRPRQPLRHRAVVDELQHRSEAALHTVDALDRSIDAWGTRARFLAHGIGAVYSVLAMLVLYIGLAWPTVGVLTVLGLAHSLLAGVVAARARRLRARKVDPLVAEQLDVVEDAVSQARWVRAGASAEHATGPHIPDTVGA